MFLSVLYMDRGFVYYIWFPKIRIFKVGRTIQGLKRFDNIDYLKFYRNYNGLKRYDWVHMINLDNHKIIEKRLHNIYRQSDFEIVKPKKEYYYANMDIEYKMSREIFLDVTNYYDV